MNRAKLETELIRDEGLKLESYQDTVGLWTIGVGHCLGQERRMVTITRDEALALFRADVDMAIEVAERLAPYAFQWPIYSDACERALVNMAFNLGEKKLAGFKKFFAALEARDFKGAAEAMMASKWATQVGDRAKRLRDMVLA